MLRTWTQLRRQLASASGLGQMTLRQLRLFSPQCLSPWQRTLPQQRAQQWVLMHRRSSRRILKLGRMLQTSRRRPASLQGSLWTASSSQVSIFVSLRWRSLQHAV